MADGVGDATGNAAGEGRVIYRRCKMHERVQVSLKLNDAITLCHIERDE